MFGGARRRWREAVKFAGVGESDTISSRLEEGNALERKTSLHALSVHGTRALLLLTTGLAILVASGRDASGEPANVAVLRPLTPFEEHYYEADYPASGAGGLIKGILAGSSGGAADLKDLQVSLPDRSVNDPSLLCVHLQSIDAKYYGTTSFTLARGAIGWHRLELASRYSKQLAGYRARELAVLAYIAKSCLQRPEILLPTSFGAVLPGSDAALVLVNALGGEADLLSGKSVVSCQRISGRFASCIPSGMQSQTHRGEDDHYGRGLSVREVGPPRNGQRLAGATQVTKTSSGATAWMMIAAVACSILLTGWPRTTNFHISAETESLDMEFRHTVPTTWRLDDVEAYRLSQDANVSSPSDQQIAPSLESVSRFKQSRFSGRFLPQSGVHVRVSRPGSGALRFQFKSSDSGPVGVLYHSSGLTEIVKTRLVVVLHDVTGTVAKRGTLVFPLLGAGELGSPVTLRIDLAPQSSVQGRSAGSSAPSSAVARMSPASSPLTPAMSLRPPPTRRLLVRSSSTRNPRSLPYSMSGLPRFACVEPAPAP